MQHKVDLDELAERLQPHLAEWRRLADVSRLTWRDERADWPQAIESNRAWVSVPESFGVRLRRGENEVGIVVWTGGWADVQMAVAGQYSSSIPEFTTADDALAAIVTSAHTFLDLAYSD